MIKKNLNWEISTILSLAEIRKTLNLSKESTFLPRNGSSRKIESSEASIHSIRIKLRDRTETE